MRKIITNKVSNKVLPKAGSYICHPERAKRAEEPQLLTGFPLRFLSCKLLRNDSVESRLRWRQIVAATIIHVALRQPQLLTANFSLLTDRGSVLLFHRK